MEFNTDVFVKNIKKIKRADKSELFHFESEALNYLCSLMIKCAGENQYIEVADVDLDAFSLDDIEQFSRIYDESDWINAGKANNIFKVFERAKPKASKGKTIFF